MDKPRLSVPSCGLQRFESCRKYGVPLSPTGGGIKGGGMAQVEITAVCNADLQDKACQTMLSLTREIPEANGQEFFKFLVTKSTYTSTQYITLFNNNRVGAWEQENPFL
jgi:hypothetical protein